MKSHVMQVSNANNGIQQQRLIWPIEADIICLFSTVEGYKSKRHTVQGSILVLNLCHQIRNWLNNYRKDKTELEFHHLLIRVNNAIGMIARLHMCFKLLLKFTSEKIEELSLQKIHTHSFFFSSKKLK